VVVGGGASTAAGAAAVVVVRAMVVTAAPIVVVDGGAGVAVVDDAAGGVADVAAGRVGAGRDAAVAVVGAAFEPAAVAGEVCESTVPHAAVRSVKAASPVLAVTTHRPLIGSRLPG
jgi:hypothetical protein